MQNSFRLASGLNFLHEKDFYFPVGKLNENRIFFENNLESDLLIDIGFLIPMDSKNGIQILPAEYEETIKFSQKYDIFSLGIIFLRMATGIVID